MIESPDGDGKLDSDKRYAHVATKYLEQYKSVDNHDHWMLLMLNYLCYDKAVEMADQMGLPPEFYPSYNYSAVRILEYPAGAITHPHTDFDLFTLMMYRDQPDRFVYLDNEPDDDLKLVNHQVHFGEMLEEIGFGKASRHEVLPSDTTQRSIVYFAIPDWRVKFPSRVTVEEWLNERMSRSRYNK